MDVDLTPFQNQKHINITTFRKNGEGVSTPVWFAEENNKVYICTGPSTFKARRIRNNPNVKIAPSTSSGKATSEYIDGAAQILPIDKIGPIKRLFRKKYRMFRLWNGMFNIRKKEAEKHIYLKITPN
ncbi:MAG: PPOX class F420-dependent oxidoreductase [Candidatus Lokiarchaeota archaeon]|nr:PPOX class F420-dependent oxidoreductase [Candidatus Lokiarchaeota archaeon]